MGPRSGDKAIPEAECTVPGASDGGVQAHDERPGPLLCSPRKSWQGTREEQRVRAGEADGWAGRRPQQAAGQQATDQEAKVRSRQRRQVKGSVARSPEDAPGCSPA